MKMRRQVSALWLVLSGALVCLGAELPQPRPGTYVHDFAGVIADDREAEIQAKARRLRDEYKTEVAVVTVESLGGEESLDYSVRLARAWGIGSKDNEVRGLLVLVAVRDRKTAFRTSRHVEGELPDGVTGEISREMNAHFKRGDFGAGLSAGMDRILARMQEVYEAAPASAASASAPASYPRWLWLPVIGLPALGLYAVLRRRARKRSEAKAAASRQGGFRKWATTKDPSAKPPRHDRKYQGVNRAGSYLPPDKQKKKGKKGKKGKTAARDTSHAAAYGYESSSYDSSSSYGSSSSSSSYDSSSSSDSGSSYSGGSDFGGGGSDSSW